MKFLYVRQRMTGELQTEKFPELTQDWEILKF